MRMPWVRWIAVLVVLGAFVLASVWSWRVGSSSSLAVLWTVVPGGLVVLIPVVTWALRTSRTPSEADAGRLLDSDLLEELARISALRLRDEESGRGVLDPLPLPVQSASTARSEGITTKSHSDRRGGHTDSSKGLIGPSAIADAFTSMEAPRRLAILGDPGGGKTVLAIRLVLELLKRRERGTPVPVLLPLA